MTGVAEPKANPGLDPGLVVVMETPKRVKRSRKFEADEPDLIAAK